jgi:hypothetical protein
MGIIGGDGPRSRAQQIKTDGGPLGATDVQEALDLIAAAGPFYTVEQTPAFVTGSAPTYATLKTLSIAPGTTRHLDAKIYLAGGTALAPTVSNVTIKGHAVRTSGGTTTVESNIELTSTIGGLKVKWATDSVDAMIQIRASGAPTVRAVLLYSWIEVLSP